MNFYQNLFLASLISLLLIGCTGKKGEQGAQGVSGKIESLIGSTITVENPDGEQYKRKIVDITPTPIN